MHGGAFGREMATARIDHLLAEAEVERLTSGIRRARAARRRARLRALPSTMLSLLTVPFRRATTAADPEPLSAAAVEPVEVASGEVAVRLTPPVADPELRPGAAITGSTAIPG